MKKPLYIDNNNSVVIFGIIYFTFDKLYKYIGPNFTDFIFDGKSEIKENILNDNISLVKLSKHEKKDLDTNCNFKIESNKLKNIVLKDTFIRLNIIEKANFYFWKHPQRIMWDVSLLITNFCTYKCTQCDVNQTNNAPLIHADQNIINNSKSLNDSLFLFEDSIIFDSLKN